jgi:hypothetical protein
MIVWGDGTVTTVRPPEAAGAEARTAAPALTDTPDTRLD